MDPQKRPAGLHGQDITVAAEQLVCNVFLRHTWYLGSTDGIPIMIDPKRRYQDQCMLNYWKPRDGQETHEEVYQGNSTYMMQQVGDYGNVACDNGRVELSSCWTGECMDGV